MLIEPKVIGSGFKDYTILISNIPYSVKIRKPQKTSIFSVGFRNSETSNYCGPPGDESLFTDPSPDMTLTAHDRTVLLLLMATFTIGVKGFHQGKPPTGCF